MRLPTTNWRLVFLLDNCDKYDLTAASWFWVTHGSKTISSIKSYQLSIFLPILDCGCLVQKSLSTCIISRTSCSCWYGILFCKRNRTYCIPLWSINWLGFVIVKFSMMLLSRYSTWPIKYVIILKLSFTRLSED